MDHRAQEQWCWEPSLMYEPIRASDMASPLQTLWRWRGERLPARVVVTILDEDRRRCQSRPKLASPSLSTVSKKRQAPGLSIRGIDTQGAFYYDVSDPTENSRWPSQNNKENARPFITNVETQPNLSPPDVVLSGRQLTDDSQQADFVTLV
jgi:hypothetical protein